MDSLIIIILSTLIIAASVAITIAVFGLIGWWSLPLIIYTSITSIQYIFLILGTIGVI